MKQIWNSDTVKQEVVKTNRQTHEEAAGMGLCDEFFTLNKIDPDAPYVSQPSEPAGLVERTARALSDADDIDWQLSSEASHDYFRKFAVAALAVARAEFDQQLQQKLDEALAEPTREECHADQGYCYEDRLRMCFASRRARLCRKKERVTIEKQGSFWMVKLDGEDNYSMASKETAERYAAGLRAEIGGEK